MKKTISICFTILIIIGFLVGFSASYEASNLDNLATVIAIAIDSSDTNNMKLSFQFSQASPSSEGGSSNNNSSIIYTLDVGSISSGINLMNAYLEKHLTLSHCKLIVISEKFAETGISDEIYTLMNNPQIRPTTNIMVSNTSAKSYLENVQPISQNLLSEYYDIFTSTSKYTGYTANATIGDFFHSLESEFSEPYAILGGLTNTNILSSSNNSDSQKDSNGKSGDSALSEPNSSEHIGIGVFNDGLLVGELTSQETLSLLAIENKVNGFLVSIPDPEDNSEYIDVYLIPSSDSKITIDILNNSPLISIDYEFSGRIQSMSSDSKYLDDYNVLDTISVACDSYLESIFLDFLYKTSKDFNSDIAGIGEHVKTNFLSSSDVSLFDWGEKYKDAFFIVNVDTNVKSSSLLTET